MTFKEPQQWGAQMPDQRGLVGFFSGEEMAARVEKESWVRLPERAGIWWKRV